MPNPPVIDSPIGKVQPDRQGAAIGAVRMNPDLAYAEIPLLLKKFMKDKDENAWSDIMSRIDYIYDCLKCALDALEAEVSFASEVKTRVKKGQNLLFKPNIVNPDTFNPVTYEPVNTAVVTPWSFVAALMRWFHDSLNISYHQMSLGEGGTTVSAVAGAYTLSIVNKGRVTTQSVLEGKTGDFYGGWGFYFTRKYLSDRHDPWHIDDPMNGYEESLAGLCLAPGKARDKLMVYDLNKIDDDWSNGRDVVVPHGVNFKTITLHKAIVGGDPDSARDRADYPGCVLINVPKLKVHVLELLTNAIKNLGIGLYPMEANVSREPGRVKWKYATPDKPIPAMKSKLPHTVWRAKLDKETGLPRRDKNGEIMWEKTGGMSATMADVLEAVQNQDIFMLHVTDAVEAANGSQAGPSAVGVPEGYVFASTDPLALDVLCARYLVTTTPMQEAGQVQKGEGLADDFLQKVPLALYDGRNIITKEGYDSPLPRYTAFQYCQQRGLGRQVYYVVGEDKWHGGSLASVRQHLGRVCENVFMELRTDQLYFAVSKPLLDLQKTSLSYIEANDKLNGSNTRQMIFDMLDENKDGVIDYTEKGKYAGYDYLAETIRLQAMDVDKSVILKVRYLMGARQARLFSADLHSPNGNFSGLYAINAVIATAMKMSQAPDENTDPFFPGLTWGKGKWPSMRFVRQVLIGMGIYGTEFPGRFSAMTPYGYAFCYADIKWNEGGYTGGEIPKNENDNIKKYHQALVEGGPLLPFVIYVPRGFGKSGEDVIPNTAETDDPALLFTAAFDNGKEVWRELTPKDFPYDNHRGNRSRRD